MRVWAAVGAVVLLASGGALGALADDLRETPRTPPGPASLLGGFSALAVQVLTIRADAATDRQDPAEALREFAELPSSGDTSYPGFLQTSPHTALLSWYSSHEKNASGKPITAIYLADLKIAPAPTDD